MKNTIQIAVLIFCFNAFSFTSRGGNSGRYPGDSLDFLEVNGKIANIIDGLDGTCRVELFQANKIVDSLILKKGKRKFTFYLVKNAYYTIRISKPGYTDRLVCVNTAVPKKYAEEIHTFNFTTELLSKDESLRLDADALDFPIAIIYFDKEEECFNPALEYTRSLKKELFSSIAVK